MPLRTGKYVISLTGCPGIAGYAAVAGKKEGEGPLTAEFDRVYEDGLAGEATWEKAESLMHRDALCRAVSKSGIAVKDIDLIFAGDLLNQCTGTAFAVRRFGIPFAGIYGACSTMALGLCLAGLAVDSGAARAAVASTSSHFCSAEKQFRMPLEYGGQRTPTAQWTATAAGAAVIAGEGRGAVIKSCLFGKVTDFGIKDPNNMGAAMAPAACRTVADFLADTGTEPADYDLILTGDLGAVGSELLIKLLKKEEGIDISPVHNDCGLMLFDIKK